MWEALVGIANYLGHYISVDEQLFHSFDKHMEKVLVELDSTDGIATKMHIVLGEHYLVE